jgi:hypothetical protein
MEPPPVAVSLLPSLGPTLTFVLVKGDVLYHVRVWRLCSQDGKDRRFDELLKQTESITNCMMGTAKGKRRGTTDAAE